ncbi:LytTR family DNA-binding domain-containing protein [Rurimicrobium arvi]|uniref:HTH LytTR-type domain-containing protein n=1 Tax=Rurimicrobium arvi TaxID=2049916 RepID=A0ABP8MII0_9BACT
MTTRPEISVYCDGRLFLVNFDEIVLLEACGSYTLMYLTSDRVYKLSKNLKTVLSRLPESNSMLKVHRSYCLNIFFVDVIYYNEERRLTAKLKIGIDVPVTLFKMKAFSSLIVERTKDRRLLSFSL